MTVPDSIRKGELGRWLVGVALAIPTVIAILLPNKLFILTLVIIMGGIAWWEFAVSLMGRTRPGLILLSLLGWCLTAVGAAYLGPEGLAMGLIAALFLGGIYLIYILEPTGDKISVNLIARYFMGHFYISHLFSYVLLIKVFEHGPQFLFYVILVTSCADIGAIYVGSRLKGPKLCEKVSPNKTISGFLGGCIAAMLVGFLSRYYLPDVFSNLELILMSLGLAFFGTFGDLFESALKRAMGIKDSSTLLLGHGGFWDRLDSLLFTLPVFYYYLFFRIVP
ncbi:MAG: phosphatidate cytidylyltransferase [Deltaproteobacteria bacterium]|jgi:phosphatidate cytidylyltransferase|nr:phosphatidate cytidylyltransferase [Deltaproteobacteria bacterium]